MSLSELLHVEKLIMFSFGAISTDYPRLHVAMLLTGSWWTNSVYKSNVDGLFIILKFSPCRRFWRHVEVVSVDAVAWMFVSQSWSIINGDGVSRKFVKYSAFATRKIDGPTSSYNTLLMLVIDRFVQFAVNMVENMLKILAKDNVSMAGYSKKLSSSGLAAILRIHMYYY